jgi:aspartate/methionine/tyrosine aminotransferase
MNQPAALPVPAPAAVLNEVLAKETPVVLGMLSALGKRFYFPAKGILSQGAEAKTKATRYNATIGIATNEQGPVHLECVHKYFNGLKPADLYVYAPSQGKPELRVAWQAKQREETPSLGQHPISLPVVTNALTHGLSVVGDLFLDAGDEVLVPQEMWENYPLCWEVRQGARISTFPLFDNRLTGFNQEAFIQALAERRGRKLLVVLNFPNNPSGYQPTKAEAGAICSALKAAAEAGSKLIVLCDDAYYGMFFADDCETESMFGRLAQTHENLLAIKVDGATKEEFVWGLRVGFITYGVKNGNKAAYDVLEAKTSGLIRATVSNINHPGQTIVLKALQDPQFRTQQAEQVAVLRARAKVSAVESRRPEYADCWDVYPFNAGYFMCVRVKGTTAEAVRQKLLTEHQTGTIALGETDLRVAFSCLLESQIPDVFKRIAEAVRACRNG